MTKCLVILYIVSFPIPYSKGVIAAKEDEIEDAMSTFPKGLKCLAGSSHRTVE